MVATKTKATPMGVGTASETYCGKVGVDFTGMRAGLAQPLTLGGALAHDASSLSNKWASRTALLAFAAGKACGFFTPIAYLYPYSAGRCCAVLRPECGGLRVSVTTRSPHLAKRQPPTGCNGGSLSNKWRPSHGYLSTRPYHGASPFPLYRQHPPSRAGAALSDSGQQQRGGAFLRPVSAARGPAFLGSLPPFH